MRSKVCLKYFVRDCSYRQKWLEVFHENLHNTCMPRKQILIKYDDHSVDPHFIKVGVDGHLSKLKGGETQRWCRMGGSQVGGMK